MNRHIAYFIAAALLVSGSIRMILQAMQDETILIPTCLGKSISVQVGASGWHALHCWGCYAALAGLVMLAALSAQNYITNRTA